MRGKEGTQPPGAAFVFVSETIFIHNVEIHSFTLRRSTVKIKPSVVRMFPIIPDRLPLFNIAKGCKCGFCPLKCNIFVNKTEPTQ